MAVLGARAGGLCGFCQEVRAARSLFVHLVRFLHGLLRFSIGLLFIRTPTDTDWSVYARLGQWLLRLTPRLPAVPLHLYELIPWIQTRSRTISPASIDFHFSSCFQYSTHPCHRVPTRNIVIMYLEKRDNMGFQIAPALIIFLVILGAGGLVVCGFAVLRFYGGDDAQETSYNRSPEQEAYMREVRERTWGKLPRLGALPLHDPRSARSYSVQSPR